MIGPVFHSPARLRAGLLSTTRPVVFDVETTGLNVFQDRVLSFGFRLHTDDGYENHVLFTGRCPHASIQPHISSDDTIGEALGALARPGLVLVGHNLQYDLSLLRREGYEYHGFVRDTLTMLRLVDQDRNFSNDTDARRDLRAPAGAEWTNYRLKDVCGQLFGIRPLYTPSANMRMVSYREHAVYLAHDLFLTHQLHDYLWQGMPPTLRWFTTDVQSPLVHLLCQMRQCGVTADRQFMQQEIARLDTLLVEISERHRSLVGLALVALTDDELRKLLFERYALPCRKRPGKKPSIAEDALKSLIARTTDSAIQSSLTLILAYRSVVSLRRKISDYLKWVHPDGRLHSSFDNKQSSGRISCTSPSLQQLAKPKVILAGTELETEVRSRNLMVASPDHVLIAADVAQADVRVLAHEIDRCQESTLEHRRRLHRERFGRLPESSRGWKAADAYRNPQWVGAPAPPIAPFDPTAESRLVQNFLTRAGDFYSLVASEVTGRSIGPADTERKLWKTILLAQINGESPRSLSERLNCGVDQAAAHVQAFFQSYPDIQGWIALQRQQVALTARTLTWLGRMRTNSAHYWMVSERRVRLLLTYKNGPRRWKYWFDVAPLRPSQRFLTCFVHRVWNLADEMGSKRPTLIYDAARGRLGTKFYSHLDQPQFFHLPVRNIPWSNIRRVQKLDRRHNPVEMARYHGLDKTCNSLVNSIMQGGTADMVVLMMLRVQPICAKYGAQLLINIHDEIVFEVPGTSLEAFLRELREACCQPPGPGWRIPIVMEFKVGRRFGELRST